MSNIIAVIWDFDKTLVNGYMQDPIFEHYQVDAKQFWKEVHALPKKYQEEQGVNVNKDTIYLNQFIHYAKDGRFLGLNNEKLKEFGTQLQFYQGIPEIFTKTKEMIQNNPAYQEYNIKVEHYIVSTGMKAIIMGSVVANLVDGIWGCELIEDEMDGKRIISEIGYTIDNTSKTKAIFEINKGIPKHPDLDVNSTMPEEMRRVQIENMIYIADGPSDIPAFSVINKNGGATFAIYPKGDKAAFNQVEQLRQDGRINMYAEADYSEGTTAYMWITNKILQFANKIREIERDKLASSVSKSPKHLPE